MKKVIDKDKLINKNLSSVKNNNKPLGRGLSALLGDNKATNSNKTTTATKEQQINININKESTESTTANKKTQPNKSAEKSVILIKLANIVPNINQPRKAFDEDKIKDLSRSIEEKGIIQPLIVRRLNNSLTKYEIVAGERRFRAASLLKLNSVPCIVIDVSDTEVLEIALIENIQRENLSPIDEAEAYEELLLAHNHTHETLSNAVSKSRPYITNYLRLLTLPSSVQNMVNQKLITVGHARALINSLEPEELANLIISKKLSVRETEKLVNKEKAELMREEETEEEEQAKEFVLNLQQNISHYLNRDVVIKQDSKGGGYIKVKFFSLDDIYRWFNLENSNIER